jgi:uncharacterized membrane protein YbaN (DUF454 family)
MLRLLYVICGWLLLVIGVVVTPMPVPIPMIGLAPFLVGCAILTRHSKWFRRGLQRVRHRFEWLSHRFEAFKERGPHAVRHMVRRTRPLVLHRRARMRARQKET